VKNLAVYVMTAVVAFAVTAATGAPVKGEAQPNSKMDDPFKEFRTPRQAPKITPPIEINPLDLKEIQERLQKGYGGYRPAGPKREEKTVLTLETGGHMGIIKKIIVTRDGRFVVSTSEDKTIRIYDRQTGTSRKILGRIGEGIEGVIYAIALSPDNRFLAAGGAFKIAGNRDQGIRIFDFATGRLTAVIGFHQDAITGLDFSPDGRFLVSGSADLTVRVWDMRNTGIKGTGPVHAYREHTAAVTAVRIFSYLNDYRIVSTGIDKRVNLYSLNQRRMIGTFSHRGKAVSVAVSPADGSGYIASSGEEGTIHIYDLSLNFIWSIATDSRPTEIGFSPDGTLLAAGSEQGVCNIYDIRNNFVKRNALEGHDGRAGAVAFLDSDTVATGGGIDHEIYLWDARTGTRKQHVAGSGKIVWGVGLRGNEVAFTQDRIREDLYINKAKLQKSFRLDSFSLSRAEGEYRRISATWGEYSLNHAPGGDYDLRDAILVIKKNGSEVARIIRGSDDGYSHVTYGFTQNGHIVSGGLNGALAVYGRNGSKIADLVGHTSNVLTIAVDGDRLVSGSTDQTIRVWDLQNLFKYFFSGQKFYPLVNIFISQQGEWAVWTEEGYFHASKNGAGFVGYHVNRGEEKEASFVSLNNLYDVFYRPDIVTAKLRGLNTDGLITLTAEQALKSPPPAVTFTSVPSRSDREKVKVCYRATSNGGGIGEVRLFHNAKLVKSDGFYRDVSAGGVPEKLKLASFDSRAIYKNQRGLKLTEKNAVTLVKRAKGPLYEDCTDLEAIPGENEISLAAFNSGNTVQSAMTTLTFNSTVAPQRAHLYILAIGIDQYRDESINLTYAAKDAGDFYRKMTAQAETVYDRDRIHHEILRDKEASRVAILGKISRFSRIIKPGDAFILFVASHGVLIQNQYYIVTSDYNGRVMGGSLISSNEIVEMSKEIRALNQLYIFDTCHAGGVDHIVSGLYDARISVLAKKMGLHIFASASDKQAAMDGYKGNGLFTYSLLDGLNNNKEADRNKDGRVTVVGLGEYSRNKTMNISREIGHIQTPVIINFGKDSPLYRLR
jgi:WD40 repeat protein